MAADEVDRYLAMTGQAVPRRSVSSPADLRLSGSVGLAGSDWTPDLTSTAAGMNEAERIAQRQARTGLFSNKASRVKGQTVTHDFSEYDDPTDSANPSHGGIVHPEIDRLMAEHNDALGQPFGGEKPQTGSRKITPKGPQRQQGHTWQRQQRARGDERALGAAARFRHAHLAVPGAVADCHLSNRATRAHMACTVMHCGASRRMPEGVRTLK